VSDDYVVTPSATLAAAQRVIAAALESEPPVLHGIVKTDRLVVFGGGVPLVADGQTIGAVGVSGGSSAQDVQVAEAGAAVLT
jgi:glc operon protein GlcG